VLRRSLILLCLLLGATSAAAAAPRPPISHQGRWLVDSRGRVVIVHGINMVYKLPPYYPAAAGFGDDDAAFLHGIGFNAVRLGVIWKALEPRPGVYDNAYLSRIATTVATLHRHGILSLLDFHQDMYNERFQGEGAPDWAVQDDGLPALPKRGFPDNYLLMPALQHAFDHFWNNSAGPGGIGLQDRYANAWRYVAKRFRSVPGLLGYELFNEPFPGSPWATCVLPGGCPIFDQKLTTFDRRATAAIRRADRRTLVFYEPNVLFNSGSTTNVGALNDPRAGFSFHDYCVTPESQGCSSHATTMDNAIQYVARTRAALLMTEFGATNSIPDLTSMLTLADQRMIPWLEWAYCGCGDPTTTGPGTVQAIVIDPHRPPAPTNRERGTLGALVEPYPQVVAGTPLSWSYNRSSKTFTLRYRTTRVSGRGRFRPGSLTEISTPRLVYPGGRYLVGVSGGVVASRPASSTLVVESCPGARTVAVTVSPGRRGQVGPGLRRC
jgi:endoglycosylceramidase